MDHKGSLPPIIEDESDDNVMPYLYRKELGRKEATRQVDPSNSLSPQDPETSDPTSRLPYNSWRSKFPLKKPDQGGDNSEMQSRLGQSLQSCHNVIPPQDSHISNSNNNSEYQSERHISQSYLDQSVRSRIDNQSEMSRKTIQAFSNERPYNLSYNETPKGYFPDHSRRQLVDYPPSNAHHMRTMRQDFHVQEQNPSPDRYNVNSYSPIGNNPAMQHSPFNPRSHFSSSMNCSGGCCSNGQLGPPPRNMNDFNISHQNQGFPSPLQVKPASHDNFPCNCHKKYESQDKKREKIDKLRKKQISDLYRIVWLQNEQIIQMQNQMKRLIQLSNERFDEKVRSKSHETEKVCHKGSSSEKRMFNLSVIEENQNLLEKVSVGIMTSFIDTTTKVTRQKQKKKTAGTDGVGKTGDRRTRGCVEARPGSSSEDGSSSTSSSSTASSSSSEASEQEMEIQTRKKSNYKKKKARKTKGRDDSIVLNALEIPTVTEEVGSGGERPLQLELQDFDTSSKSDPSESSEESETESPMPVGWTFYDKVVGKVKNMLDESDSGSEDSEADEEVERHAVEHIRKLGLAVEQSSPASKRVTFDSPFYQRTAFPDSDTSMKMNALAMKYYHGEKSSPEDFGRAEDKAPAVGMNGTNLSLATLRYLERYHLPKLASQPVEEDKERKSKTKKEKTKREEKQKDKRNHKKSKSKTSNTSNGLSGKILDITAIKQQPKLLPKKH